MAKINGEHIAIFSYFEERRRIIKEFPLTTAK
jgi:hypothetical protein